MYEETLDDEKHLLVWKSVSGNTKRAVVVIPGNPGSALFYVTFCEALWRAMDEETSVCVVGHAGHYTSEGMKDAPLVGLFGQVLHKRNVLKGLLDMWGADVRLVLCGHSIGSWVCLTLLREFGAEFPNVDLVVHLMPTVRHLHKGMTPLVRLAIYPTMTWVMANVVHYMPQFVRDALIWVAGHDTDEIKIVSADHINYYTIRNVLSMAAEEAKFVVEPQEAHMQLIRANVERHFFVYSQIDHYTPLSYLDDLKAAVGPNLRYVVAPKEVEHAFVLRHPREVASMIVEAIRGAFVVH